MSSANIYSDCANVVIARIVISKILPIGVETMYNPDGSFC